MCIAPWQGRGRCRCKYYFVVNVTHLFFRPKPRNLSESSNFCCGHLRGTNQDKTRCVNSIIHAPWRETIVFSWGNLTLSVCHLKLKTLWQMIFFVKLRRSCHFVVRPPASSFRYQPKPHADRPSHVRHQRKIKFDAASNIFNRRLCV